MKCKDFSFEDWKKNYGMMKKFCEENKDFNEFCLKMKENQEFKAFFEKMKGDMKGCSCWDSPDTSTDNKEQASE